MWLANNKIKQYTTVKNYRSSLEVNVESGADINLGFENGVTVHCHLNFFEKSPKRNYRFVFENASIEINYFKNEMNIFINGDIQTIEVKDFERNQMFEDQCKYFMNKTLDFSIGESLLILQQSKEIIKICR